jgi:hypothetical protein
VTVVLPPRLSTLTPVAGTVIQVMAGDYTPVASETYRWMIDGQPAGEGPAIAVPDSAVGKRITVQVTASSMGATAWQATLGTVEVKASEPFRAPTLTPRVAPTLPTLTPTVGAALEVLPGDFGVDQVTTSCVWRADGQVVGSVCRYTPDARTVGRQLTVTVTVTGRAGMVPWVGTITTAPVTPPAKTPDPSPAPSDTPTITPPSTPVPTQSAGPVPPAVSGQVPVMVRVKVSQKAATVLVGRKIKLSAAGYLTDGSRAKVSWKSNRTRVATVSNTGTITAKRAGKAVITIKSGTKTTKVNLTVVASTVKARSVKVTSVTATGIPKTMTPGQVGWATGKIKPARAAGVIVRFTSSNPTTATIDTAGRIVAKQAGKTTITIKAGNKTRNYTITVS